MNFRKLNKVYTQAQIENYLQIAPLPHPSFLDLIDDEFIKRYSRINQRTYKKKYLLNFINFIKLFNNVNLSHEKNENVFAISHSYFSKVVNFHIKQEPYFNRLLQKRVKGFKPLKIIEQNGKKIYEVKGKGYSNGYIKLREEHRNLAYTTIENATRILDEYIQTRDIDTYIDKYNYYATKNRSKESIIIEQLLEKEEKIEELKITGSIKIDKNDVQELYIPGIEQAIHSLAKQYQDELEYWTSKNAILGTQQYIIKMKQIKELNRNLKDLNRLLQYIENDTLYIVRNVKEGIERDYHFITYFSKRLRKDLFEDLLGFYEFDLTNAAYRIIAAIFSTEPIYIKTIEYYANNRDEAFRECLKALNIDPKSSLAKSIKKEAKIEYLAILMGKQSFDVSLGIPKEEQRHTCFYELAEWIKQDVRDLRNYIMENRERFERDFNVKLEKKNCISNLFMKVESLMMNEMGEFLKNQGIQFFRIHDAIYVRNFGDHSIIKELKNIENKYLGKNAAYPLIYNSFRDVELENQYISHSYYNYIDIEEKQKEFEEIYQRTKENLDKILEEQREIAQKIKEENDKNKPSGFDNLDRMYLSTLEKAEYIKRFLENRLQIEFDDDADFFQIKMMILKDDADSFIENLKKAYYYKKKYKRNIEQDF